MFSHLGIQLLSFFTIIPAQILFNQWLNPTWHQIVSSQPLVLQFIEILIVVDFFSYWIHRTMHEVPFLWRIHAVHHSSEKEAWDKNFAAFLPIYDVIFKTAHLPAHLPKKYGTTSNTRVPEGFMAQLVYPIPQKKRKKN